MKKLIITVIVLAAVAGLGYYMYQDYLRDKEMQNPKFYSGNGRLEATEVFVSAKLPGRIETLYVKEGDLVKKGDKLVQMQVNTLEADKAATIASIKVAEGELAMAQAIVRERESAYSGAEKEYNRQKTLVATNASSQKTFEKAETDYNSKLAALDQGKAKVIAAEGQLAYEKAQLQRIEADIADSTLIAKYDGRVQYLIAHEGEVLSAGGRVMNLVNLTDCYMTFFLPTNITGKVSMGAEVRLIFDADTNYSFDAKVTYIDPIAQFTPKSVETRLEREKLMFRIKASLDAEILAKYIDSVKTGLPGVAWIKLDSGADWTQAPVKIPELAVESAKTTPAAQAK